MYNQRLGGEEMVIFLGQDLEVYGCVGAETQSTISTKVQL